MEGFMEVRKKTMQLLFFKGIKIIEKERIRLQIVTDSLEQIVSNSLAFAFSRLKTCQREVKTSEVTPCMPEVTAYMPEVTSYIPEATPCMPVQEETYHKKTVILK